MGHLRMWQEAGVVLVVGAALYYLARKFFGSPRRKPNTTFVPLKNLKK
jgi:hypothetical protein